MLKLKFASLTQALFLGEVWQDSNSYLSYIILKTDFCSSRGTKKHKENCAVRLKVQYPVLECHKRQMFLRDAEKSKKQGKYKLMCRHFEIGMKCLDKTCTKLHPVLLNTNLYQPRGLKWLSQWKKSESKWEEATLHWVSFAFWHVTLHRIQRKELSSSSSLCC